MGAIVIDNKRDSMPKVKDRFSVIERYVKGKDVLDLGCINHDAGEEARLDWLHGFIEKRAKSVTGVDYLQKEVAKLRKKGHNILCANVETMRLGKRYDVVVAGELIEHLDNVGLFLDRVAAHLKRGGVFIVTTPNAFSLRHILRSVLFGTVPTNTEHTCLFCPKTLKNIVERHGFRVAERYFYFDDTTTGKSKVERLLCL
ncbi:MAG: class I SAM-dependent methyltransferase, partial [Patescibacteria group bacterium]